MQIPKQEKNKIKSRNQVTLYNNKDMKELD